MKVGDIVTNWPYGEPLPYMGIIIEIKDKMARVMWIPQGDVFWMKTYSLSVVENNKKIRYYV